MNTLPDFVTEGDEERRTADSSEVVVLTGWESVVFQLDDEPELVIVTPRE